MADDSVLVTPAGDHADTSTVTTAAGEVHRQRFSLADDADPDAHAKILATPPAGAESGLVTRNIPSGVQDVEVTNFPATQPVSGTVGVNNFPATDFAVRIDGPTAGITYVGKAAIGASAAAAVWQIRKIDETSGTAITWADGNASFDNVWNDRATLGYS